jgi:hypothetical protein
MFQLKNRIPRNRLLSISIFCAVGVLVPASRAADKGDSDSLYLADITDNTVRCKVLDFLNSWPYSSPVPFDLFRSDPFIQEFRLC